MVSLGSCSAVDVVNILQKKRHDLTGLEVTVTGEQATEGWPRPFTSFHIHYKVTGRGLKDEDVKKAITLSEEKYCSVSATLRAGAEITWDYEVIETDG
jgi:putative redox protein